MPRHYDPSVPDEVVRNDQRAYSMSALSLVARAAGRYHRGAPSRDRARSGARATEEHGSPFSATRVSNYFSGESSNSDEPVSQPFPAGLARRTTDLTRRGRPGLLRPARTGGLGATRCRATSGQHNLHRQIRRRGLVGEDSSTRATRARARLLLLVDRARAHRGCCRTCAQPVAKGIWWRARTTTRQVPGPALATGTSPDRPGAAVRLEAGLGRVGARRPC